jgi:hypothetical protein
LCRFFFGLGFVVSRACFAGELAEVDRKGAGAGGAVSVVHDERLTGREL